MSQPMVTRKMMAPMYNASRKGFLKQQSVNGEYSDAMKRKRAKILPIEPAVTLKSRTQLAKVDVKRRRGMLMFWGCRFRQTLQASSRFGRVKRKESVWSGQKTPSNNNIARFYPHMQYLLRPADASA